MSSVSAVPRTIRIKLFGGFRQFRTESILTLETDHTSTVADLRERVAGEFGNDDNALSLLKASAFATDTRVLDDDETLPDDTDLALLPPVCGG